MFNFCALNTLTRSLTSIFELLSSEYLLSSKFYDYDDSCHCLLIHPKYACLLWQSNCIISTGQILRALVLKTFNLLFAGNRIIAIGSQRKLQIFFVEIFVLKLPVYFTKLTYMSGYEKVATSHASSTRKSQWHMELVKDLVSPSIMITMYL